MISVKRAYEQGNLQFTMAKARNAQGGCFLLDCDMDENSNLFLHTTDLFKHLFTGGTNPIDIHEYIVHSQKGVDLGYELCPVGEPVAVPVAAPVAPAVAPGTADGTAVTVQAVAAPSVTTAKPKKPARSRTMKSGG